MSTFRPLRPVSTSDQYKQTLPTPSPMKRPTTSIATLRVPSSNPPCAPAEHYC
ncbi:hypothetical protein M758_11G129200 [Ceratodon purpureus]|nr:hypothetical protein M758_11G129200 [Ceratodon purpureus]